MTRPKKAQHQQDSHTPPDSPAVVTTLHVQDRILSPVAGAPRGYRKLSAFQAEFEKGKLAGGKDRYDERARFEAGMNYAEIFLLAQSSGKDSTQALNVSKSGGGLPLSIVQQNAIRSLICIHAHMSERDRDIIKMVCGQDHWPAEAVKKTCGDYQHTVAARFREALDSLIEAMEAVRRNPGVVMMDRLG